MTIIFKKKSYKKFRTLFKVTHNFFYVFLTLLSLVLNSGGLAANEIKRGSLIRDAEIEATFKEFLTPLFQVAGLDPKRMHLYLIMNPEINAAASLNCSLFINTGLIMESKNVEQLLGVLAHETGHIAGEHMVRTEAALQKANIPVMASVLLGTVIGAATGNSDASMAVLLGGQQAGEAVLLHYSRGQEAAADQAATKYLAKNGWSATGLLEFMEILDKQDLLSSRHQDPYRLTHPLTKDRINFLRHYVDITQPSKNTIPAFMQAHYRRMKAKLSAFLVPPGHTLAKISSKDTTLEGRYARAIALYRGHKLDEALSTINSLITEFPDDPYFHELKGQMFYENGHIQNALPSYKKAVALKPDSDLMRIMYAQILIEMQKPDLYNEAITELNKVKEAERYNPMLWRLLATAYGKKQNMGMMSLMLAEQAIVEGDMKRATSQAERALKQLSNIDKQAKQRAKDILNEVNVNDEQEKNN